MDYCFLSKTMLFRGIAIEEMESMLQCLGVQQKQFPKEAVI